MARQQAEGSNRLSIFWLKKYGYLAGGWRSGGIKWTHGWRDNESSIGFTIIIDKVEGYYINLRYTHTSYYTDEKIDMDYRVGLVTTACNYDGVRYWFICPLTKNGYYCGRRVGVLFSIGKWYGCRTCGNIAYAAQMEGGQYRIGNNSCADMERLEEKIKRYYYRGKPTRQYRRLMKMDNKLGQGWLGKYISLLGKNGIQKLLARKGK